MIKEPLLILEADKVFARKRIKELEDDIQALGPEFYDVFNQSSETWHDNAPFDALCDRQSVMAAELQTLKRVLSESAVAVPKLSKNTVGIGSFVTVRRSNGDQYQYFIAGDWTPHAGKLRDGYTIMSSKAPLAKLLIGKKINGEIDFSGHIQIQALDNAKLFTNL